MKLWEGANGEMPETGCCTASDSEDARKVAAKLDIPYYVMDYTESFSEDVVDNFVGMYAKGLTPNPCVECNRSVKFDHFITQAKKLKCEKVATGHYAKIIKNKNEYELHKADYLDKDQSYVLHMLNGEKLEYIDFPLGTISKPEVRQIAAELGLKTAFKKDSQDICFVGKKDYRNFVNTRIDISSSGEIVDKKGKKVDEYGQPKRDGTGINGFKAIGVHWSEHPERDEKWANDERARIGEERFRREHDCEFIAFDETLIDGLKLVTLAGKDPLYKAGQVRWYERPKKGSTYVCALDPSLGTGGDYSAIQVFSVPEFKQVAEWQHNKTTVQGQARTLLSILQDIEKIILENEQKNKEEK